VTAILGVDLGERRIGLAIADDATGPAMPLATVRRARTPADDVTVITRALGGRDIAELVVGLPLEASGVEGPQARTTLEWARELSDRLGLPLSLRDERLSSHLAETRIGPMRRGRSGGPPTPSQREAWRARVDREAAAIILQDELDARARLVEDLVATPPPAHGGDNLQPGESDR
jgi:putative transcription antitermination factor YqgF